jgi:hypothetical protein
MWPKVQITIKNLILGGYIMAQALELCVYQNAMGQGCPRRLKEPSQPAENTCSVESDPCGQMDPPWGATSMQTLKSPWLLVARKGPTSEFSSETRAPMRTWRHGNWEACPESPSKTGRGRSKSTCFPLPPPPSLPLLSWAEPIMKSEPCHLSCFQKFQLYTPQLLYLCQELT